ncbi:FAD-dependent 5-carboxymethylaminomethyl-2-thiouridine(34) oxidoreductase MnmC [Massilia sp. GCM10020059]|uniref:FAD-dependent 5-carboxymethylaminomethyl-2-thiouridine(34) oxidoreductase MnmC n=1 Tax=Massilia agrisoli TaxID=2892444 RepID=A0ABS8INU8_9BURK|nr:FAD-dependent 5-carboxymethylaminomethyl-2-thiouridine(34) oxidoreductase MnmC [Massilia agrisoli]MCC6069498.1 FAD-dependent 5-carboxymethylaminomethyl-2-thiouridine(34) oxidoreductase MnmC [Massilia agrisoli]
MLLPHGVTQVDLAPHWRGRDRFVILDSAWGAGERLRAVLAAWRADEQRPRRLHYIAIADPALPGFRRIPQQDSNVTLDLLHAPIEQALAQLDARADAIVLHELEGAGVAFVRPLAKLAAPGTVLFSEGLDGEQEEALAKAGFASSANGPSIFASRKPFAPRPSPAERRAIVVGAGVAGSAACERLCARGWQVTLVERHAQPAMEASGNLAGIFMPLLSRDDNIPTRLTRAAYLFALDYWNNLGGIGQAIDGGQCGVMQLARDPAHARVQREIAQQWRYPAEFAQWLEAAEAGAMLGSPAPDGAWLFRQGGWARPGSVCAAMLAACGDRLAAVFNAGSTRIERRDGQWRVLDAAGGVIAQAPVLVLANGTSATSVSEASQLPLAKVRGQVSHLAAGTLPALPFVLCREAYLTSAPGAVQCAGATYDLNDPDPQVRQSSHDENLAKVRSLLGMEDAARGAPLRGRTGFRCVAPDRLPLVGALADARPTGRAERLRDLPRHPGLYGLLGYASRGLIWAPLAAELLAAQLEGEPLPLERALAEALDPARFMLGRARKHDIVAPTPSRDAADE